jgi:hypothetical protein
LWTCLHRNSQLKRRVHQRLRNLLKFLAVGTGLLTALVAGLYLAAHHVPAFYARRTVVTTDVQRSSGVDLERKLLALHDDTHAARSWQAAFSEEQINAWLAVELPAKFPELLPEGFEDPRVALEPNQVRVACRYVGGPWATVLNLRLEVGLADEANTLAVRLASLRAGLIPLPLQRIVDGLAQSAARADLNLRWAQSGGDPVALITLGTAHPQGDEVQVLLEHVEIAAGEVRVAGRSTAAEPPPTDAGGAEPTSSDR